MNASIDTAVIMAGGAGMRLRPYTTVLPKPLMPLGDRPLLEILIRRLAVAGVREVIVSVNHLAHIVRAVIASIDFGDLRIRFVMEDRPLGTCGALSLMAGQLPERFLVSNGDVLTDYPVEDLVAQHLRCSAALSVATQVLEERLGFGVIERDTDGRVRDYVERPARRCERGIGIYVLERGAIERHLAPDTPTDMPTLIGTLLADGQRVEAVARSCTWIDIGRPEDYLRAQDLHARQPDWPLDGRSHIPHRSGEPR